MHKDYMQLFSAEMWTVKAERVRTCHESENCIATHNTYDNMWSHNAVEVPPKKTLCLALFSMCDSYTHGEELGVKWMRAVYQLFPALEIMAM